MTSAIKTAMQMTTTNDPNSLFRSNLGQRLQVTTVPLPILAPPTCGGTFAARRSAWVAFTGNMRRGHTGIDAFRDDPNACPFLPPKKRFDSDIICQMPVGYFSSKLT